MFSSTKKRHSSSQSFDGNLANGLPNKLYKLLFSFIEETCNQTSDSAISLMDGTKIISALTLIEKEQSAEQGIALLKEFHHPLVHYYLPRYYLLDQKLSYPSIVLKGINALLHSTLTMNNINPIIRSNNFIFAASLYRDGLFSWLPRLTIIVHRSSEIAEIYVRKALELSGKNISIDIPPIYLGSIAGVGIESILRDLDCTDIRLLSRTNLIKLSKLQNAVDLVNNFKELYGENWGEELESLQQNTLIGLAYFAYVDENFVFSRENINVIKACNEGVHTFKLKPISSLIDKLGLLHDLGPRFSDISRDLCLSWHYVVGRRLPNPEDVKLNYLKSSSLPTEEIVRRLEGNSPIPLLAQLKL